MLVNFGSDSSNSSIAARVVAFGIISGYSGALFSSEGGGCRGGVVIYTQSLSVRSDCHIAHLVGDYLPQAKSRPSDGSQTAIVHSDISMYACNRPSRPPFCPATFADAFWIVWRVSSVSECETAAAVRAAVGAFAGHKNSLCDAGGAQSRLGAFGGSIRIAEVGMFV